MALIGIFREGIENVRFTVRGLAPLSPYGLSFTVRPAGGIAEVLTLAPAQDADGIASNEFRADWVTTDKNLGLVKAASFSVDEKGRIRSAQGNVKLVNSYGRNYGEDYGYGL